MPAGRPSSYDPAMVIAAAAHIAGGGNARSLAVALGISRDTLYVWRAAYPDFAAAMRTAQAVAETAPLISLADPSRPVISLAAWGIPHRTPTPIAGRIITDEDVDDMLAEAA